MLTHDEIRKAVVHTASLYPIKQASYFGSYAEGTQTESDSLGLLLKFKTPAVSLLTLTAIKNTMEDLLNVPVDVIHSPNKNNSMLEINKVVRVFG
jgi:predicted nucleotidyltransferase